MERPFKCAILLFAFAATSVFAVSGFARAGDEPTQVTIDPLPPIQSGAPMTLTGSLMRLTVSGTEAIPHRHVKIYLETVSTKSGATAPTIFLASLFSDEKGRLKKTIHTSYIAGHYRLYFIYEGSPRFEPNHAVIDLFVTERDSKNISTQRLTQLSLTINSPTIDVGETVTLTARLSVGRQAPMPDRTLHLKLADVTLQKHTDSNGEAVFIVKKPLAPGSHQARVSFDGSRGFTSSSTKTILQVNAPTKTTLVISREQKREITIGDEIKLMARLTTSDRPLPGRFLRVYLDGKFRYGAKTDIDGKARLKLPHNLIAGTHVVSVTYRGAPNRVGLSDALRLEIVPQPLEIETVPQLPNVKIRVGDQVIQTNENGLARLSVESNQMLSVTVLPHETVNPNIVAKFVRWSDTADPASRTLNVTNGKRYQIGFEVHRKITVNFSEDHNDRPVDPSRVKKITLLNSAGEIVSSDNNNVFWLKTNSLTRLDSKLVSSPLIYYLHEAWVEGINVVNEGQQRFEVTTDKIWVARLHIYDVHVTARDALFGYPVGRAIRVVGPKGSEQLRPLNAKGFTQIESLSRGNYVFAVQGASGIAAPTPISLSRSRELTLAVISYFDLAVMGGCIFVVAGLALLIGKIRDRELRDFYLNQGLR
jgi:hypothetical protein